jgi:hypothetical protein
MQDPLSLRIGDTVDFSLRARSNQNWGEWSNDQDCSANKMSTATNRCPIGSVWDNITLKCIDVPLADKTCIAGKQYSANLGFCIDLNAHFGFKCPFGTVPTGGDCMCMSPFRWNRYTKTCSSTFDEPPNKMSFCATVQDCNSIYQRPNERQECRYTSDA